MKKVVSMVVMLVLVCIACMSPALAEDQITFGICWFSLANESVQSAIIGAEAKAEELGIKLIELDSEADSQKESDNALSLLNQGVDGIIVNPCDAEAFLPMAKQINEAGIPLVVVFQDLPNSEDLRVCYVGCNDFVVGQSAGEIAIEALGAEGGNVVIIEGQVGSTPQIQRTGGFEDAVKDCENIKILETQCSPWDRAKAVAIMEDFITKYQDDIDLVFTHDDNLAVGAVEALASADMLGQVKVVGYNGTSEVFNLIKEGSVYATMIQPMQWGGATAVETLYKSIQGEEVEGFYYDPMQVVTAENVDTLQPSW